MDRTNPVLTDETKRAEPVYYSPTSNAASTAAKRSSRDEDIQDEVSAIQLAADISAKQAASSIRNLRPASESRMRIRQLLDKHRSNDEERTASSRNSMDVDPLVDSRRMLWIFR